MDDTALVSFCNAEAARRGAGFFADMAKLGPARWTTNMRAAVARAAARAAPAPAAEALTDGAGFARIVAMFDRAGSVLKRPAVLLSAEGVGTLRISVAGPGSRFPGSLNVAERGPFGSARWFGRVLADGRFEPSRRDEVPAGVRAALAAFAADPVAAARAFGRLTGSCCFCARPLSDARSVSAGFGPVCADRFGLEWGVADVGGLLAEAA